MKKLFTLLVLLVTIVTGAWAETNETISWPGSSLTGTSGTNVTAGTAAAVDGSTYKAGTISISSSKIQTESKKHQTDSYWEDFSSGTQGATSTNATSTARIEFPINIADDYAFNVSEVDFKLEQGGGGGPAVHVFLVQGETSTWIGYTSAAEKAYQGLNINLSSGSAKLVFVLGLASNLNNGRQFKFSNIAIKGTTASFGPSISADDVNISKDATSEGEISFSVSNPVVGGEVTADTEADWLTLGTVDNTNGKVPFTATANAGAERSATVTLTYTYNTSETVTKDVTVTQAAPTFAITYNHGTNGSGSIEAGEKSYGVDFTLSSETFTREGYVQSGWATEDGGAKAYDLGGTYSDNAAIELFPVWAEASTYFAPFSVAEGTPTGWTFSTPDPDTWAADNARVAFVKDFADNSIEVPKNDGKMSDSYIAFAKNAGAYAIYDLGSAVSVYSMTAKLYGGSGSAFKITIEYLGEDGTTVRYSDENVSLGAGNWALNTITKSIAVSDVRYIKIYGGSKWVVMSGFSVTSTAAPVSTGAKITTNAGKWASFTPTYNAIVPAGTEAYIITGIDAGAKLSGEAVSVMEAGKGYFIKGDASTEYTATYTTEAADATTGNMLVGCAKSVTLAANSGSDPYQYFLGTDGATSKAGLFYVGATAITIPAGLSYLQTESNTPLSLTLPFEDEETAINIVNANDNADSAAPIKVVKNGQLFIGNYNVAGQQVK